MPMEALAKCQRRLVCPGQHVRGTVAGEKGLPPNNPPRLFAQIFIHELAFFVLFVPRPAMPPLRFLGRAWLVAGDDLSLPFAMGALVCTSV